MKLTRRFLALLLAFSMSLSMVTPAFASETETESVVEEPVEVVEEAGVEEIGVEEADEEEEPEAVAPVVVEIAASEEAVLAEAEGGEDPSEGEEPAAGTQENPAWPEWNWNDAQTEASVTITVPAGETYYFNVMFGGMEMTVNDGEAVTVNGSRQMPEVHSITNDGAEEAAYTVKLAVPVGSDMNPEVIDMTWIDVALAENDQDGYFYSYTAEGTGNVELYLAYVPEGIEADIRVTTTASYTQYTLLEDGVADQFGDLILTIPVTEGDVLTINVGVSDNQAAEFSMVGSFSYLLGSEQNPIPVTFEWNDEETEATATVVAPVGTTYYSVFGGNGMMLSINDEWPIELTAMGRSPAVFTITNDGEAEAEYSLVMTYPEGHSMNPYVIENFGNQWASVAQGDWDGYVFTYTAAEAGTVYISLISAVTYDEEYNELPVDVDIVAEKMVGEGSVQKTLLNDGANGILAVEVAEGETLNISVVVNDYNAPAAEVIWDFNNAPYGSEANPAQANWIWNEEYTEASLSVFVPAGETYYLSARNIAGMLLTVGDAEAIVVPDMGWGMPYTFAVKNEGEEDAEFTVSIAYPVGTMSNPEVLEYLGGYAVIEEGNNQGYFYRYTAEMDGYLMVNIAEMVCDAENVTADITLYNNNTFENKSLSNDGVDNAGKQLIMEVQAGDVIDITVTRTTDDWTYPAAEISWNGSIAAELPGNSADNAILITMNPTAAPITVNVPAGETVYYQARVSGMILTVPENVSVGVVETVYDEIEGDWVQKTEAYDGSVFPNAMGAYTILAITNNGEAASFALTFSYPVGSQMNPDVVGYLGEQYASQVANDWYGYFTSYTAEADGNLEFYFVSLPEGVEGDINVTLPSGTMLNMYDAVDGVITVPVTAGDELNINTVIFSEAAADYSWYINYTAGHALNPIYPEFVMNDGWTEGDVTVTVPAGETYYFAASADGMELTINGGKPQLLKAAGFRMPAIFTITNDTGADAEYALHLAYPVGSWNNPEELTLGKKTASITEGNEQGYFYTWTAPSDGVFSFTMNTKSGWVYAIDNTTSGAYGDEHASDGDKMANQGLYVNEGDILAIRINKLRDSKTNTILAGKLSFTTSFQTSEYTMVSGKSLTLKFVHPETGKSISASKVNWEIDSVSVKDPNGKTVEFDDTSAYATLKNGKLSTYKNGDSVFVVVLGTLKEDENIQVPYYIEVLPVATKLAIWGEGQPMVGTINWDVNPSTIDPETEYLDLDAYSYPSNAQQDVTWKSSNTKVMTVDEEGVIRPVWDAKKGEYKTGTVTITATAKDGSGKKASFKVKLSKLASYIEISRQDGEPLVEIPTQLRYEWDEELQDYVQVVYESVEGTYAEAGTKLKLTATIDPNASDKTVNWECGSSYAKVSKGTVTIAKDAPQGQMIYVYACDKEYRISDYIVISVVNTAVNVDAGIVSDGMYVRYVNDKDVYFDVSTITSAEDLPNAELFGYAIDTAGIHYDISDWRIYGSAAELKTVSYWTEWLDSDGDGNWDVENRRYDIENAPENAYITTDATLHPVWDAKKNACKTGTVTITAVAPDGKTKASFKVTMVSMVNTLEIKTKDGKNIADAEAETFWNPYVYNYETGESGIWHEGKVAYATAGKALTLTAEVNQNAANKKIYWWAGCPEYPDAVKMSNGKLTVSKDLPTETVVWVEAYSLYNNMYVMDAWIPVVVSPIATNVHIRMDNGDGMKYVSNTTKTWDVNDSMTLELSSLVYPFDAGQDVNWTVSNKNIATIEDHEDGTATLTFTDKKFGKLTITGTAADGSKVKTSFTLNVLKSVQTVDLMDNISICGPQKLADFVTVNPANATNTKLNWSMFMYEDGNKVDVPKTIATLSSGKLTPKTVSAPVDIYVTAEAADGFGAKDTMRVTIFAKTAGMNIFDVEGAFDGTEGKIVNGKTVNVTKDRFVFDVAATNAGATMNVVETSLSNNEAFAIDYTEDGEQFVYQVPDENGNLTYGKVKVTATPLENPKKAAYVYVNFVAPVAEG